MFHSIYKKYVICNHHIVHLSGKHSADAHTFMAKMIRQQMKSKLCCACHCQERSPLKNFGIN